jgi:serine/threonine protein phosphatase PrpC
MIIHGLSDIGKVRTINQDAFAIETQGDLRLIVVCDGMGGAKAGEVAAAMAVASMKLSFSSAPALDHSAQGLIIWLENAILKANYSILQAGQQTQYAGMGTTMVAVLIAPTQTVAANIGDSRLYGYTPNNLTQLSEDHSLVQEMINQGQLTLEDAKHHPQRAVLTQVLGVSDRPRIDVFSVQNSFSCLLACTDGVHTLLSHDVMTTILDQHPEVETALVQLIQAANDAGGIDNATAVLACVERSS